VFLAREPHIGCAHFQPRAPLAAYTPLEYGASLTVIESPLFAKLWPDYWKIAEEMGHATK